MTLFDLINIKKEDELYKYVPTYKTRYLTLIILMSEYLLGVDLRVDSTFHTFALVKFKCATILCQVSLVYCNL